MSSSGQLRHHNKTKEHRAGKFVLCSYRLRLHSAPAGSSTGKAPRATRCGLYLEFRGAGSSEAFLPVRHGPLMPLPTSRGIIFSKSGHLRVFPTWELRRSVNFLTPTTLLALKRPITRSTLFRNPETGNRNASANPAQLGVSK